MEVNLWIVGGILLAIGLFSVIKRLYGNGNSQSQNVGKKVDTIKKVPPIERNENEFNVKIGSKISAKNSFIENIDKFRNLLPTLNEGTFNPSDWTDYIIDINNGELIEYWKKAHTSVNSWIRLLASWGLKTDDCSSFKAMSIHQHMYIVDNGCPIELGKTYNVTKKCWILTNPNNQREIIVIGEVKEQE